MRKVNVSDINYFSSNNPLGKHEKVVKFDREGKYIWYTFIGKHIIYPAYFIFEDMFGNVHKILDRDLLTKEYYIYDDTKFVEVLEKQKELVQLNVKNIEDAIEWLKTK